MAWAPNYLEDGDDATAASLNGKLTGAQATLENIEKDSLHRGAFGPHHAATTIITGGFPSAVYGDDGLHVYPRSVFGASINYATFGANGGSSSGADLGTGDRLIVGHPSQTGPYGGTTALVSFGGLGIRVGMNNGSHCAGILVDFNCEIQSADTDQSPVNDYSAVMFCIQFRLNSAGTWYTIDLSERFMSINDHVREDLALENMDLDCPITTLIRPATLTGVGEDPATDYVTDIRAMMSLVDCGANSEVTLNRWRLSAAGILADLR